MPFARRVFLLAGWYGLLVMVPMWFLGGRQIPPLNHPEYYFGFVGLCVAWQVAFLVIARDPVRFRPLMLVAILEKVAWVLPVYLLTARHQVPGAVTGFATVDLALAVLFAIAYRKTAS